MNDRLNAIEKKLQELEVRIAKLEPTPVEPKQETKKNTLLGRK
jgi:hypothetical protein